MTTAKTYRDLTVWQSAHNFVMEVYRITRSFPTFIKSIRSTESR